MESIESNEQNKKELKVKEIVGDLEENVEAGVSLDKDGDTYEIESDSYNLSFTLEEKILEIRNIDVRGNAGLGSVIVSVLHEYADKHDFEVIASNVKETARGFWVKMGYQEGGEEDEFFRVE